jgi:hypothetical protein
MIAVQLVMFSAFDLDTFLPIARKAKGRGVSADAITSEVRNMLCVAGLIEGQVEDVEAFYTLAYLIAVDERDVSEIVQLAGMPHVVTDTVARGIQAVVITGTLHGWYKAVRLGCRASSAPQTRKIYNMIYTDLDKRGLCGTLGVRKPSGDGTFLLESSLD